MAITPFKTFVAGEVLTASDLNSSFSQIIDNGEDLAWPASQNRDFNGFELILDSDGDSSLHVETDDRLDVKLDGTDIFRVATVTSATNGLILTGAASGNDVTITSFGGDSNVDIAIAGKGDSILLLDASDNTTADAFQISASAMTTGDIFSCIDADALTTGAMLRLTSNSASTSSRALIELHNDNTAATGTKPLRITQDAADDALHVIQNANATAYYVAQNGAGAGVRVDQIGEGNALFLNASTSTSNVLEISASSLTTGDAISIADADSLTTGAMLALTSNSSDTSVRELINLINDNSAATGTRVLRVQQDSTGNAVFITQAGNGTALRIDSSATTAQVVDINANSVTTGNALNISADSVTTGNVVEISSNSSNTSTRQLINLTNDNTAATGTRCLRIQQDSTADAVFINHTANGTALTIGADSATNSNALSISADSLTTGSGIFVDCNASNTSSRAVIYARNDHASAVNCYPLRLDQDADNGFIRFTGSSGNDTTSPISANLSGNSIQGHIQISVNGAKRWLRFYDDPTNP